MMTSSPGLRIVLSATFSPLAAPTVIRILPLPNDVPNLLFSESAIAALTSSNPALLIYP